MQGETTFLNNIYTKVGLTLLVDLAAWWLNWTFSLKSPDSILLTLALHNLKLYVDNPGRIIQLSDM